MLVKAIFDLVEFLASRFLINYTLVILEIQSLPHVTSLPRGWGPHYSYVMRHDIGDHEVTEALPPSANGFVQRMREYWAE